VAVTKAFSLRNDRKQQPTQYVLQNQLSSRPGKLRVHFQTLSVVTNSDSKSKPITKQH
jgi:hypothetical protein